jgi:hypothetical protein
MSITVRPQLTAGIAALSASAIIAATVTATPQHLTAMKFPELPGVTSSVELAALLNPLSAIDQTLQTTVTGVGQFVTGLSTNPLIAALIGSQTVSTLKQLVTIGQSALSDLGTSLTQDLSSEAQTVLQLATAGNWQSALNIVESTAQTIKSVPPVILQAVLLGSASQLLQSVTPGITALQSALKSGNLGKALNAVVTITKTVISSVLGQTGLISQLLAIAQALGQINSSPAAATAALKRTSTAAAAAALPLSSAKSLTLPVAATAAAVASAAAVPAKSTATTISKATKDRGKKQAVAGISGGDNTSSPAASTDTSSNAEGGKVRHGKGSHTKSIHKGSGRSSGHGAK